MARYPEWFARLDAIIATVQTAEHLEWFGRNEIQAVFSCSERDSIRLLHKFGAEDRENALSVPRSALVAQLEAIRAGSTYARFAGQRQNVARQLAAARVEASARQFRIEAPKQDHRPSLQALPGTITLRPPDAAGPGLFRVLYIDAIRLLLDQPTSARRGHLFLGMLEMARDQQIEIDQDEAFGPVRLRGV